MNLRPFFLITICSFWVLTFPSQGQSESTKERSRDKTRQYIDKSTQLIVAIAPDWASAEATMQCYERGSTSAPWKPVFNKSWPVLLGSKGLAWGRGIFTPTNPAIPEKTEKDHKAPAGVFDLGKLYGSPAKEPKDATWPYQEVGPTDVWIDDPRLPNYNQWQRLNPQELPAWFKSQRMKPEDKAYKWLLEIRHNSDPPKPGYGSAIFFHLRRGPNIHTAGCTTMEEGNLEKMIRWLRKESNPRYVLLPKSEYDKVREKWGLP